MSDIITTGNKRDKWTLRVTELLNWLNDNKSAVLTAGDNITLTPQEDGTIEISAEGGGVGGVADVQVDGTSVVDANDIAQLATFTGATSSANGTKGLVKQPLIADKDKFLKGDGTWAEAGGGNVDDVVMNGQSIVDANKVASFNNYVELTQAQYDALPASKLTDGILYCIKDTGIVEGDKYAPIIYSLEEREVGVWTDGKPLYQKTIYLTNLTKNDYTSIYLTDLNIDHMCYLSGYYLRQWSTGSSWELYNMYDPYSDSSHITQSQLRWKSDTQRILYLNYVADSGNTFPEAYITIQYTKTTDVPGSGTWGTDGVPMVHYDGNERVIGTWFGETLYEKSFQLTNSIQVPYNSWTSTGIPAIGINKTINSIALGDGIANVPIIVSEGNNIINVMNLRNTTVVITAFTIQYTKTS